MAGLILIAGDGDNVYVIRDLKEMGFKHLILTMER
jgi:uncharacterized Zn ribbon protein